ncbi:hypothetical protein [Catellatospora sichuanensis]|uniref:hypothetical protein n=1 Tax=Catellatospora sichuanensis TaxID=1969805 RepID=UPI001183BA66|nr:hypothetical protein [Catellatospora sichuanensis]
MSSTAVPAAPAIDEVLADLALQTNRLRIAAWAVGGAGLLVTAAVANIPGDAAALWRLVAMLVSVATPFAYIFAVRPLWRLRRQPMLTPSDSRLGFVTVVGPPGHALTAFVLAGGGILLGLGRPGAAFALALVLLAVLMSLRPTRIVVTPSALRVRSRLRTRSVPWARLTGVRVTGAGDDLRLAVDRAGRAPGTVRLRLAALDVDPAFLVHLLQHYRTVPEDRTAIGAPAELARRRAAYLASSGSAPDLRVDPSAQPAAALP